jgi:hypothetical protein
MVWLVLEFAKIRNPDFGDRDEAREMFSVFRGRHGGMSW